MLASSPIACKVEQNGVWYETDANIGEELATYEHSCGPRYASVEGLRILSRFTTRDERVRPALEALFGHCWQGLFKVVRHTKSTQCVLDHAGERPGSIIIQLWQKDSAATFYPRTHLHPGRRRISEYGFLEVEDIDLEEESHTTVPMPSGGLSIIDARTLFRVEEGRVLLLGFAKEEYLGRWRNVVTVTDEDSALAKAVRGMETDSIKIKMMVAEPCRRDR